MGGGGGKVRSNKLSKIKAAVKKRAQSLKARSSTEKFNVNEKIRICKRVNSEKDIGIQAQKAGITEAELMVWM